MVTVTALVLVGLVVIVTVIVSAAVIVKRRKHRDSPGVVQAGPQSGRAAAILPPSDARSSSALKPVAPGNEQVRIFNTYDFIADLPPIAMATAASAGATESVNDDYLKPCLNDEDAASYWPEDHYERVKILDDDNCYYNYN